MAQTRAVCKYIDLQSYWNKKKSGFGRVRAKYLKINFGLEPNALRAGSSEILKFRPLKASTSRDVWTMMHDDKSELGVQQIPRKSATSKASTQASNEHLTQPEYFKSALSNKKDQEERQLQTTVGLKWDEDSSARTVELFTRETCLLPVRMKSVVGTLLAVAFVITSTKSSPVQNCSDKSTLRLSSDSQDSIISSKRADLTAGTNTYTSSNTIPYISLGQLRQGRTKYAKRNAKHTDKPNGRLKSNWLNWDLNARGHIIMRKSTRTGQISRIQSIVMYWVVTPSNLKGGLQEHPDNYKISDCERAPCRLRKNSNIELEFKFTSDVDAPSLKNNVYAKIVGIPFPFIGVDGTDACPQIYLPDGSKAGCPLKAGQDYVYKNSFKVLEIYPKVQLQAQGSKDKSNQFPESVAHVRQTDIR
ncbi:Epididymal secretory protein E1 [Zootermopsis nevadensis]|uniref:Epididymal secretory protein E1 n=1 Tax=Zootermopsis nevadensis TaxID=136037 RepID=A0A067RPX0_ZOONE|nr:Epididymal secretory protein E1 [Zootermopsis nevadensis]